MFNPVIVMPVYQHAAPLKQTLENLSAYKLPIIVVNDGSDKSQSEQIRQICDRAEITLVERPTNGGKGAAVIDGLKQASRLQYSHAFQIDADGQHDLTQVPVFLESSRAFPDALILGCPSYDETVPAGRKMARWLTHIWVWINTLSLAVRDSMCGFRVYPLNTILKLVDQPAMGRRMDFDVELCVRACWKGIKVINLPVQVVYPDQGHSNFRLWEDNKLITFMHTRLFFGMLWRSPMLLYRTLLSLLGMDRNR